MVRLRWFVAGLAAVAILASLFTVLLQSVTDKVDKVGRATARSAEPAFAEPTRIRRSESLFRVGNFERSLAALRRRVGNGAPMVKVQLLSYGVDFHIRRGERDAYGFQWFAKEAKLRPVEVRVLGPGGLDDEDFPLETVSSDAVRRLAARVREEDPSFEPRVLTLARVPPDGYLLWTVVAETPEHGSVVWHARPNGTGFAEPGAFARRFRRQ
jgi:hypothetical protein